jgi:hypothetical protein
MDVTEGSNRRVVGGVDTHKDLHVAAVVDEQDCVLGTQCFATTRQGYRQMLAWMQSFGDVQRIGIESTGSYGAGLLRFMQRAGIEVLEVTTPDKHDRRRRGKNDDMGVSDILCLRPVSSLADEPLAEDDGELGSGLSPFSRRPFPFRCRVIKNEI